MKLIVALDVDTLAKAEIILDRLKAEVKFFKVGHELFTAAGPAAVEAVKSRGADVFLDLKFHDIPNTVAGAVRAAAAMGVSLCNVHAQGGRAMMEAAAAAKGDRLKVIAVTVLTSLKEDDLREVGVAGKVDEQVLRLASLAKSCGLDGVVASGLEAKAIRQKCGKGFLIVTPGVRPSWAAAGPPQSAAGLRPAGNLAGPLRPLADDQKRVVTPAQAFADGADHIVVGRPITEAPDPAAAAKKVLMEIPRQRGP